MDARRPRADLSVTVLGPISAVWRGWHRCGNTPRAAYPRHDV